MELIAFDSSLKHSFNVKQDLKEVIFEVCLLAKFVFKSLSFHLIQHNQIIKYRNYFLCVLKTILSYFYSYIRSNLVSCS